MSLLWRTFVFPQQGRAQPLARCLLYGIVAAAAVFALRIGEGRGAGETLFALLVPALAIPPAMWGAERFWLSMMRGVVREPLSPEGFVLRIPFLYVACGMCYAAGMLTAARYGLVGWPGVPVQPVFVFGARTGTALYLLLQGYRTARQRVITGAGDRRGYDKGRTT